MHSIFIVVFNFITGSLCLMYGVNLMSSGLEKTNSRVLEKFLTSCTGNTMYAFITGTAVTALVQSSTAVTVITVGLVNSGLMKLTQAVGIIYGANLGTTITAQLMSFKVTDLALPVIAISLLLQFASGNKSVKSIASAFTGMGLMFLGIGILNSGVPFIKENPMTYELFKTYGKNPHFGLIIGMITTMLVHSSSATVGLTIVLFNSGLIGFEAALGLTLGDNLGTCITAQLASLGTSIPARRTAWAHTLYNGIGVVFAMIFLTPFASIVKHVTFAIGQDETRLVANSHTLFNVLSAAAFLPITRYYVKFIEKIVGK